MKIAGDSLSCINNPSSRIRGGVSFIRAAETDNAFVSLQMRPKQIVTLRLVAK